MSGEKKGREGGRGDVGREGNEDEEWFRNAGTKEGKEVCRPREKGDRPLGN